MRARNIQTDDLRVFAQDGLPPVMTLRGIAESFGVSVDTVRRWTKCVEDHSGQGKRYPRAAVVRPGKNLVLVSVAALWDYLSNMEALRNGSPLPKYSAKDTLSALGSSLRLVG